jgi:lysozyme
MARTPPKTPAIIALAVLISAPFTAPLEGLITHPNPDPGKPDLQQVCYGDTEVPMRTYTADECLILLKARQARDYAPPVLKCVPGFADPNRRYAFAASIDAAYNAGPTRFCKSPMARAFNAGRWTEGCNLFPTWITMPGTRVHKGLIRRRTAEKGLCLKSA